MPEEKPLISLDDFKKLDLRIGKILSAERVPQTDKLLRLSVDLGEGGSRQIVSGIAAYFPDLTELIGKECLFVANLEPRVIRGLESQGMILAATDDEGRFSLLHPSRDVPAGMRLR